MTGWLRQVWVVVRVRFGGPRPAPRQPLTETAWDVDGELRDLHAEWDRADEWRDIHEVVDAVLHHHDQDDQWGVVNDYRDSGYLDLAVAATRALMFCAVARSAVAEVVAKNPELARLRGDLT